MKTIEFSDKTFAELSNEERKSFLSLSVQDETIPKLVQGIENGESVNIEVAFTNEGTAIDYRVFDPYHLYTDAYTYADGWSNWFFENYDEDDGDDEVYEEEVR